MAYKLKIGGVTRLEDGQEITPQDPAWQEFAAWLAAGNVPQQSDTGISLQDLDAFGWTLDELPFPLCHPVWQPAGTAA
jgi:hypothetical protein